MMTEDNASHIIRNTFDDEPLEETELEELFLVIYHRPAEDDDREQGLWSLLCAGVTGCCGCSTRTQHTHLHNDEVVVGE